VSKPANLANLQHRLVRYVICKDGTLHHMLNDYLRAWHAGVGKWEMRINSTSIGIEIDNNGVDSFQLLVKYIDKF
jgi:N-acetyl-anhydromuramyl-L-alanine amidase AmpD